MREGGLGALGWCAPSRVFPNPRPVPLWPLLLADVTIDAASQTAAPVTIQDLVPLLLLVRL